MSEIVSIVELQLRKSLELTRGRRMPSHGQVAAKVREYKTRFPHLYCAHPGCLWRTETTRGPNPCRNHPNAGSGKPLTEEQKVQLSEVSK